MVKELILHNRTCCLFFFFVAVRPHPVMLRVCFGALCPGIRSNSAGDNMIAGENRGPNYN